jgi:outer membrane receptor protein involved in Fe transport
MNKKPITFALLVTTAMIRQAYAQPAPPAQAEQIVVTGSRVLRLGDESPTPLTAISTDELSAASPANITEGLNKLPIFSGVNGQRLGFAPASQNLAGNYLNLREFGAARTLILLDGKRVPPTTSTGLVDVNLLPQLLVKRVDVVTGGASAVYGSDAITGVVNYVLDSRFEGVKVQASTGISGEGDYRQTRLGAAFGSKVLGGRGHLVGSFEAFDNPGLLSTDARDITRRVYFTTGSGTAANPYVISKDVRWNIASPGGNILAVFGPDPLGLTGQVFEPGGTVRPFVHGTPTNTAGYESGGDGFYFRRSSVAASLRTEQGFLRFGLDINPDLQFYGQASLSQSRNLGTAFPFTYLAQAVPSTNAFLDPTVAAGLSAAPAFLLFKSSEDFAGTQNLAKSRNWSGLAGVKGALNDRFNFDVSFSHANSLQNVTFVDNINLPKLGAALDSVVSGGQIVCRSSLTTPNAFPGCVPINPFGRGSESAAAHDYVTDNTNYHLTNTLDNIAGSITGSPFSTPAGPVDMAFSGEYRRATLKNVSNASSTDFSFDVTPDVPKTSQTVYEAAVEADIPLLKGAAFAKALNLNAAYRVAHYDTVGNARTWKLGSTWQPVDWMTLRATRSRDFRAPTLTDLFAPSSTSISGFNDVLTGTTPNIPATTGANPDLEPEVSDTFTLGAVFKLGPRSSVSVDLYSIKIANSITTVNPVDPAVQRLCISSGGTSPFCDLIVRPNPITDTSPANAPTAYFTRPMNAASLRTSGVDVEANHSLNLGAGQLALRGLLAYQPHYKMKALPGAPELEVSGAINGLFNGAVQLPRYRFTGFANYTIGQFSVDLVQRWRSSIDRSADKTLVFADGKIPSVAYTDVTLKYRPSLGIKMTEFFLSVQNLFDKAAPLYSAPGQSLPGWGGFPSLYRDDSIGRYFTVGLRAQF